MPKPTKIRRTLKTATAIVSLPNTKILKSLHFDSNFFCTNTTLNSYLFAHILKAN